MARGSPKGVFGLEDGVGDELACVLVLQAVENARSVLPGGHQASKAHFRQVLGYRGRRLMNHLRQPADRQLTVAQGKDDPDSGCVSEHGEHLNSQFHILAVRLTSAYFRICIHTYILSWFGDPVAAARPG